MKLISLKGKSRMCPTVGFDADFQVWESALNSARSILSDAKQAIQGSSVKLLPLPIKLWKAASDLKSLVGKFHSFEDKVRDVPKNNKAATFTKIGPLIDNTFSLCNAIEELYGNAKRRGYTNRTLTAASLNLIKSFGEELFEVAENVSLMLDERTDDAFQRARDEFERGECVGMDIFS